MSRPIGRPPVLDEAKRHDVLVLLANGNSRRAAAGYVGCAAGTISRTAARDPEFAKQLARAEQRAEIECVRFLRLVGGKEKYWRAAAWFLERRNPDEFAPRRPARFTGRQVIKMLATIMNRMYEGLPIENQLRAEEKLREIAHGIENDDSQQFHETLLAAPYESDEQVDGLSPEGLASTGDLTTDSNTPESSDAESVEVDDEADMLES